MRLLESEIKDGEYILTFEKKRLFRKPVTVRYIGSSTVWHTFPEFKRCGTLDECWLSDLYKRLVYERKHGKEVLDACNSDVK